MLEQTRAGSSRSCGSAVLGGVLPPFPPRLSLFFTPSLILSLSGSPSDMVRSHLRAPKSPYPEPSVPVQKRIQQGGKDR